MPVTIDVREEDIAAGRRESQCLSPVAIAIVRALNLPCLVFPSWVCFPRGHRGRADHKLPMDEEERLREYDYGGEMHPHTFEL